MGDVIQFPRRKSCFKCVHHVLDGVGISTCLLYDDTITSETHTAELCDSYEVKDDDAS